MSWSGNRQLTKRNNAEDLLQWSTRPFYLQRTSTQFTTSSRDIDALAPRTHDRRTDHFANAEFTREGRAERVVTTWEERDHSVSHALEKFIEGNVHELPEEKKWCKSNRKAAKSLTGAKNEDRLAEGLFMNGVSSLPFALLGLFLLALAVMWAVLPLIILSKFNELLKIEREANRARAELAKAIQWMLDNWK